MLKKTLLLTGLFALLITPFVFADVDPEGADPVAENIKAVESVTDGAYYQIFTYSDGNATTDTKFYLKTDGYLTSDPKEAGLFPVKMVNRTINCQYGDIDVTAFKFDFRFTNPTLDGQGGEGNLVANGHINIASASNNRDDWEAQVFFLGKSGNYAIRATAAKSENWGANTFWTTTDTDADGMPEAEYSLTAAYIWKLVDATAIGARNDLEAAIETANATVTNREGVGEGLFMKSEADLQALSDAVNAAKAVADNDNATVEQLQAATDALNQARATYAAAGTKPEAGKAYTFQLKDGGCYMTLSEGTKLNAEPADLFFEEVEGGWAITNGEGAYVACTGTGNNVWTMGVSSEPYAWSISSLPEGYYAIAKASNTSHHIGVDNTEAGSSCYADKGVTDKSMWTIAEAGGQPQEEQVLELAINVERTVGQGYTPDQYEVDLSEALTFLGVEAATEDMLFFVNPDGSEMDMAAYKSPTNYDGWCNEEGAAAAWNSTTNMICVKFFEVLADGKFSICDMNDADQPDKTYAVKWALKNGQKKVVYTINLTFKAKEVIELTFADLNKLNTIELDFESECGSSYEAFTSDVDIASILATLGVDALNGVNIYAVQSDGSLDDSYKLGATDGWRNADGDWQNWGENARICVKSDFTAESSQIYYIGGMDGQTSEPATYTATFAFVKNGSKDAVVLKVNLKYTKEDGITGINAETKSVVIYDLSGRRANRAQKGVFIVNGKKVTVK